MACDTRRLRIYKDTENLDFEGVVRDFFHEFGLAKETLDKLYDADLLPGPGRGRSWVWSGNTTCFERRCSPAPNAAMLSPQTSSLASAGDGAKCVSLWKWCGHGASARAFFGDALLESEPAVVADYLEFDETYWRLKTKSPETAARETRQKCVSALRRWLDRPRAERGDACWMVSKAEQDFADLGICDDSQLAALLLLHLEM